MSCHRASIDEAPASSTATIAMEIGTTAADALAVRRGLFEDSICVDADLRRTRTTSRSMNENGALRRRSGVMR